MRKYKFHPDALQEFQVQADYYKKINIDLSDRFYLTIEKIISQIRKFPQSGTKVSRRILKNFRKEFPFTVFYSVIDDDSLFILAVAHQKRRPGYWKTNLFHSYRSPIFKISLN